MSCIWAERSKQVGNLFSVYVHQRLDHIIKHVHGLHDVLILKKKKGKNSVFSAAVEVDV